MGMLTTLLDATFSIIFVTFLAGAGIIFLITLLTIGDPAFNIDNWIEGSITVMALLFLFFFTIFLYSFITDKE